MGCFLRCFGGSKDCKCRNHRDNRTSPRCQKKEIQNVEQEKEITAEKSVVEKNLSSLDLGLRGKPDRVEVSDPRPEQRLALNSTITTYEHDSVSKTVDCQPQHDINDEKEKEGLKAPCERTSHVGSDHQNHRNESEGVAEHLSASSKKRVTFDSNVAAYEHASVCESIVFQTGCTTNNEKETKEDSEVARKPHSISQEENSVVSSVGSYPPNHWHHDEAEEYSNSDLDNYDSYDEDVDVRIDQDVWSEMIMTSSMESTTGNHSPQAADKEEGESRMVIPRFQRDEELMAFGLKVTARYRNNYTNSVLNPIANTTQWKAAKSRGQHLLRLLQKENLSTTSSHHIYLSAQNRPSDT